MTRLFRLGRPVDIRLDPRGRPLAVYLFEDWRPVANVGNHWRVGATWWSEAAARDYWRLALAAGNPAHGHRELLVTVYQNQGTGSWYLERVYD